MPHAVADWAPALLPTIAFAIVLFLPGAVVLWLAGASIRRALVLGPLVTGALTGVGAVLLSIAGIAWNPLSFAGLTVAAVVAVALVRMAVARRRFRVDLPSRTSLRPGLWWALAGLAVNAVVVAVLYLRPVGSAAAISYEYDTIWHFSTIRWILETGDASSVNIGLLDGTAGSHFYPAAWHGLVALTTQLTGSTIGASVHGSILAILLTVWPIGMIALFRRLFPGRRVGAFAVAALAFLPAAFPIGFLDFGVLWSNFFSLSLVPAGLLIGVAILTAVRDAQWRRLRRDAAVLGIGLVSIPLAMLFGQPNAAFTLLVILLPLAYSALFALLGRGALALRARLSRAIGLAVFTVVLVVAWIVLHDSSFLERTVAVDWPAYQTRSQAVGEWVFFGNSTSGQLLLGALVVTGLIWAVIERRSRWFAFSYGVLGALFVVASGLGGGPGSPRDYLVGFWYHDSPRIAAAGVVVALPFAAYAFARIVEVLTTRWTRRATGGSAVRPSLPLVAITVVVSLVVVGATVTDRALRERTEALREQSRVSEAQWLSPSERDFLAEVRTLVGPEDVVANNPFDGSAMAYSLDGIRVLFPALPGNWMGKPTDAQTTIIERLNRASTDPAVCRAAEELGVRYVVTLEHGARGVFQDGPSQFPGLAIDASTPGFDVVAQHGPLTLYRVAACDVR